MKRVFELEKRSELQHIASLRKKKTEKGEAYEKSQQLIRNQVMINDNNMLQKDLHA